MSSHGVRKVYTRPIARSNSKVDVEKNSLSGGQVNSIVTGPPGALLFDVKPEIALKESLELLF